MSFEHLLHRDNYRSGFLIDEEWMAGVSEEGVPPTFNAFIVNHVTGEAVGYTSFPSLEGALEALSRIPRKWKFESTAGCSGGRCEEGRCKGGSCKVTASGAGSQQGHCDSC